MEFLLKVWQWLTQSRTISDVKLLQDIYRTAIEDLKKDLAQAKEAIKEHRKRHPDNGVELDEWAAREDKLHKKIIALMQENMVLKEELIFLKKGQKDDGHR